MNTTSKIIFPEIEIVKEQCKLTLFSTIRVLNSKGIWKEMPMSQELNSNLPITEDMIFTCMKRFYTEAYVKIILGNPGDGFTDTETQESEQERVTNKYILC